MDFFDLKDDFQLCDKLFCRFAHFCNEIDVATFDELERVVLLVWQSFGLIGNGGFRYLFEGDFNGDQGFIYTAAAYHRIGALDAYRAFQDAFRAFPRGLLPDDVDERLKLYDSRPKKVWDQIERRYYRAEKEIVTCLARFIRENREGYEQLLRRKQAEHDASHARKKVRKRSG